MDSLALAFLANSVVRVFRQNISIRGALKNTKRAASLARSFANTRVRSPIGLPAQRIQCHGLKQNPKRHIPTTGKVCYPHAYTLNSGPIFDWAEGNDLPAKTTKSIAAKPHAEPWKAFQVRHRSPELKREAVIKTAAHLFLEHGYQKTSMSLLAAQLKVTKPALYYYFRNKEELLVECYRSGIAEIENNLGSLSRDAGTGLARLRLYVHEYATVVLTHEFGRCVAMIDDSELSAETRRGVRDLKRRVDASFRRLVAEGIEDGSIADCNPKLLSFAIAGAVNWAGTWYNPAGELSPEQIAQAFTAFLTGGLGPRDRKKR
jgi:AcrR family transcriptional regulator